jgi:hypothetical protein
MVLWGVGGGVVCVVVLAAIGLSLMHSEDARQAAESGRLAGLAVSAVVTLVAAVAGHQLGSKGRDEAEARAQKGQMFQRHLKVALSLLDQDKQGEFAQRINDMGDPVFVSWDNSRIEGVEERTAKSDCGVEGPRA